jgi:mannose-6-phosphate isomerase
MLEKSDRPWGRYEVLQEGATYKVKSIHVLPGKRLSYQRHQKRSEHGSIITVPQGCAHRMSNTGESELIFIEVQTGSYFGEDDIERIEDDFGR